MEPPASLCAALTVPGHWVQVVGDVSFVVQISPPACCDVNDCGPDDHWSRSRSGEEVTSQDVTKPYFFSPDKAWCLWSTLLIAVLMSVQCNGDSGPGGVWTE